MDRNNTKGPGGTSTGANKQNDQDKHSASIPGLSPHELAIALDSFNVLHPAAGAAAALVISSRLLPILADGNPGTIQGIKAGMDWADSLLVKRERIAAQGKNLWRIKPIDEEPGRIRDVLLAFIRCRFGLIPPAKGGA